MRRRSSGRSRNFTLTSYKKINWPQLEVVVAACLHTSSKKSATSAAAKPLSFLRTLRFSSSRNRRNAVTNASEAGSSLLSVTRLQGRITGEPAGPSSGWSMEMLTITDDRPTGSGEEDQLQKCSYIYPRTPALCGVHPIATKFGGSILTD